MNTGDIISCSALNKETKQFLLGEKMEPGSQGVLWHATDIHDASRAYVFKLITDPVPAHKQRKVKNIQVLLRQAKHLAPTPTSRRPFRITLPLYLYEEGEDFGYIMDRADGRDLNAMMTAHLLDAMSPEDKLILLCQIADAIYRLSNNGYCYQDISHRNFMYQPVDKTHPEAYVTLIDCDNITSNAKAREGSATFARGTGFYMPPEVAFRMAPPSIESDCYALAMLFFKILMGPIASPYHGKALYKTPLLPADMEQAAQLTRDDGYGYDWLTFVFDPVNKINEIDPTVRKSPSWQAKQRRLIETWATIPAPVQKLFADAFASPLDERARAHRPHANVWLTTLRRCLSSGMSRDRISFIRNDNLLFQRELSCPFHLDEQSTDGFVTPRMGIVDKKANETYVFRSTSPLLIKYRTPASPDAAEPIFAGGEIELVNGTELFFAASPSERVRFILNKVHTKIPGMPGLISPEPEP